MFGDEKDNGIKMRKIISGYLNFTLVKKGILFIWTRIIL